MCSEIWLSCVSDRSKYQQTQDQNFMPQTTNSLILSLGAGWTDKSSISMFEVVFRKFLRRNCTIVLHDFDECARDSRETFLNYFSALSNKTEWPLKLAITSRKPNALSAELAQWPGLDVDSYIADTAPETLSSLADITHFCPIDSKRREIRENLNQLSTMGHTNLHTILGLLSDHTNWPNNPSVHSLSEFTRLLSLVSPSDTPEIVLDKIIRSDENTGRLRWVLGWLLCSYRPLRLEELATVVEYHDKCKTTDSELSVKSIFTRPPLEVRKQLKNWFRMFIDFQDGQAIIRPDIRRLLVSNTDTVSYAWNEVADEAHQKLAEFCLACVKSDEAVASLGRTFQQYESALQDQRKQLGMATPPLVLPGDQGLLLYSVQALPYHLSKCSSSYRAGALPFFFDDSTAVISALWAKVYWAMSNPLSRTPTTPASALPVCAGLGLLSHEKLDTENEDMRSQCMSSAIIGGNGSELLRLFPPNTFAVSTCIELLLSALQANDQTTALDLAQHILSNFELHSHTEPWPRSAIWTAVWLNMVELANILLDNGVGVDTEPYVKQKMEYLHLSSLLDHPAIVETLLARGAASKAPESTSHGSFLNAASRGHIDVLQKYLNHDASVIKTRQPDTALFSASESGCWHCVGMLIDAGADVNEPQGIIHKQPHEWTPLAVACWRGYSKTVKELLAGGADANTVCPQGINTVLWYPASAELNVDCVRVMLRYNADPNHHLFDPSLLIDMARSSHDSASLLPICNALLGGARPININGTDKKGVTALMIASWFGKLELVQWLLAKGAATDVLDSTNKSALYYAIGSRHVDVVAALLKKGARIDVAHASGEDPLLFKAILTSRPDIVQLLLDSGADPNLATLSGEMAINVALTHEAEFVKILIEKGADINRMDSRGWTPMFIAV